MPSVKAPVLEFKEVTGDAPVQPCNCCGKKLPIKLTAAHPDDSDILIAVCSDQCATDFNAHPGTTEFLASLYAQIQDIKFREFFAGGDE